MVLQQVTCGRCEHRKSYYEYYGDPCPLSGVSRNDYRGLSPLGWPPHPLDPLAWQKLRFPNLTGMVEHIPCIRLRVYPGYMATGLLPNDRRLAKLQL